MNMNEPIEGEGRTEPSSLSKWKMSLMRFILSFYLRLCSVFCIINANVWSNGLFSEQIRAQDNLEDFTFKKKNKIVGFRWLLV